MRYSVNAISNSNAQVEPIAMFNDDLRANDFAVDEFLKRSSFVQVVDTKTNTIVKTYTR